MASSLLPNFPSTPERQPLAIALRQIAIFADLSEDKLQWFASNSQDLLYPAGEILIHEGDPADALFVILEGEIRGRRESAGPDAPVYIGRAGQVTGMLPFSRMTVFQSVIRAALPCRIARLHIDHFPEMLQRIPELLPRLVGVLSDRVREFSRVDQQREKLMALGKLSAGLAHELNNPSSAARRAAEGLRGYLRELRGINKTLDNKTMSCQERSALADFEERVIDRLTVAPVLDALEQSDREDELGDWLRRHEVRNASKLTAGLVEAGVDAHELEGLTAQFRGEILSQVLSRVVAAIGAEKLTKDIESSTGRIADLVRAVKEYSYMDQAPEQEVDIHQGIESTLTMLKFRLKKGVEVKREFDRTLPRVFAHGSELNQVWTNLIDNAIDAMNGKGVLRIRTSRELNYALVEMIDNGSGISDELRPHMFEPFFTTKGVGSGTGLGLDTVYRIVRAHHGDVSFESKPGETNFQVRIPFGQPKEGTK